MAVVSCCHTFINICNVELMAVNLIVFLNGRIRLDLITLMGPERQIIIGSLNGVIIDV